MPLLITSPQRSRLRRSAYSELPSALAQTLASNHARVLDLFRALDKDGDGVISRHELRTMLMTLGMQA